MKIPEIRINYHYPKKDRFVSIRYGISWDGLWFFQIVTPVRHGCGYQFDSNSDDWEAFIEYLHKLNVKKRIYYVKKVLRRIKNKLDQEGIPQGPIYKFKTKTLFKEI